MFQDRSYKISFILALVLHVALIVFLFCKLASHSYMSDLAPSNVMQAFTVMEKTIPTPEPQLVKPQPVAPKPDHVLQQNLVQKEMQKEMELEKIALLKKTEKDKKKKLKDEESKLLQEELKRETQKLKTEQSKAALQKELEKSIAAEKNALAKSAPAQPALSSQMQGELDRYKAMLLQAVSSNWVVPDGVTSGSYCLLLVDVAPGGVVLGVKLLQSSGNAALDRSAQAAILKSSPLPVPEDPALFDRFRSIKLTVRPEGIE